MRSHLETDVVVVGGGLAGLDVTVVERRRPPIDKPCGEDGTVVPGPAHGNGAPEENRVPEGNGSPGDGDGGRPGT